MYIEEKLDSPTCGGGSSSSRSNTPKRPRSQMMNDTNEVKVGYMTVYYVDYKCTCTYNDVTNYSAK